MENSENTVLPVVTADAPPFRDVAPASVELPPKSPPVSLNPPNFKKVVMVAGGIFILSLVGVSGYYLGYLQGLKGSATEPISSEPFIPEGVACTMEAKMCPDGTAVGRGGLSCEFAPCPGGEEMTVPADWMSLSGTGYSLSYPEEFTVRELDDSQVLLSLGPTQTDGTEIFDGMMISLMSVDLKDVSLEEYVDAQILSIQEADMSTIIQEKAAISIGQYQGFFYQARGLGIFSHIFLQGENSDQALEIITLVEDPGELGFQTTMDQVLASIQLL